jgi:hypothetical protein
MLRRRGACIDAPDPRDRWNCRTRSQDYRIITKRHLGPYFDRTALDRVKPTDIEAYIFAKSRELSIKTIANHLNFDHGVFRFALRRGWATSSRAIRSCSCNPIASPRGLVSGASGRA